MMNKVTFTAISILLISGFMLLTNPAENSIVSAQSASCPAMSYNTPIIVSGSASGRYSIAERISGARAIELFGGPIANEAEGKCAAQAAQLFGPEAQNCMDICSSVSTPQEPCTGTVQLHGNCDRAKCSATANHHGPTSRWGEVWEGTIGKISCNSNGRFTVACVCSSDPSETTH